METAWNKLEKIKSNVDSIIKNRILILPTKIKVNFPLVIREDRIFYNLILSDRYIMLNFTEKLQEKIEEIPALITFSDDHKAAFAFPQKSRNNYLENSEVCNLYSLKLGNNCSIILSNHKHIININEQKNIFEIKLAYILTFGDDIRIENIKERIDDLIIYSISLWSEIDEQ